MLQELVDGQSRLKRLRGETYLRERWEPDIAGLLFVGLDRRGVTDEVILQWGFVNMIVLVLILNGRQSGANRRGIRRRRWKHVAIETGFTAAVASRGRETVSERAETWR